MQKLAIFVEGLTERLFVERLIREITHRRNVQVEVKDVLGPRGNRRIRLISKDPDIEQAGYILIQNCCGDQNVVWEVRNQYSSLAKNGYNAIIGLRDLRPKTLDEMKLLLGTSKKSFNFGLRTNPIQVQWILALMEIEAWFLAEHTHFTRIHSDLTLEKIHADLGFDPSLHDMEERPTPAEDLHNVYNLVGLSYTKTAEELERTITALDIALIYFNMLHVLQLRLLVDAIDHFIATCVIVPAEPV